MSDDDNTSNIRGTTTAIMWLYQSDQQHKSIESISPMFSYTFATFFGDQYADVDPYTCK